MAWYKTGTITVTNGSTTVTGSGTSWIANAGVGEALYAPDGRLYEITNIASDTSFTIAPAYLGSTQSGQAYVLVPSQSYIRDLASQAADLVNNYSTIYNTIGQGKFPDGTLADPAFKFSDDLDTGFYRSASNEVTFVAGGVAQFKYNTSGLQFTGAGSLVNLTTTGNTTLGDASTDTVTINATTTANAPMVVSANSTTNALRITQVGSGNALLVEDSANPDATPFVVDADGRVLMGVTSSVTAAGTQAGFQLWGSTSANSQAMLMRGSADATAPFLNFAKSRNTTVGSFTIVQSGDGLGAVRFAADDGTDYSTVAAQISAEVDGAPSTNDMPGRLVFSTTADGASSPTERMRIDSAGQVGIGGTPATATTVDILKNLTGGVSPIAVYARGVIQSDGTGDTTGFYSRIGTAATAFTVANLRHFRAFQGTFGATSSVTTQVGYFADSSLTGATNNYGFYSNIAAGTGRWNFYANGTAANYFAGLVETANKFSAKNGDDYTEINSSSLNFNRSLSYVQYLGTGTLRFRDVNNLAWMDFFYNSGDTSLSIALKQQIRLFTGSTLTERLNIGTTGLVELRNSSGLSISRTAVTSPAASDGNVFSGTYTPTLTNTLNVTSSTAVACQYMRVGNVVTVSGQVTITSTAAGNTELGISIPIASNLAAGWQAVGTGRDTAAAGTIAAAIIGDVTNDRLALRYVAASGVATTFSFTTTYLVI